MCFPLGARWSKEGLREYVCGLVPGCDHFALSTSQADEVIGLLLRDGRVLVACAAGHPVTFIDEDGRSKVFSCLLLSRRCQPTGI
jgi:hypothetical protein